MEFATPEDEIKYLRKVLSGAWDLFCDCYLAGTQPDAIRQAAAFRKLDAKLRELGILRRVT